MLLKILTQLFWRALGKFTEFSPKFLIPEFQLRQAIRVVIVAAWKGA